MSIIKECFHSLNNRELALLIWILFAIIWVVSYPKIRKSFFNLIKAFFKWKLTLAYLLMFLYITCLVLILKAIAIWKIDHIPLTVLWSLCVAFSMLFNYKEANRKNYFKNSIKDNMRGLVFVEFFVNLYVFNLWIELIIVPMSAIIVGMKAITEKNKEYETIDKFLNLIFILGGFSILFYVGYKTVTDFENFATIQNLESFYMPILLSILFTPFVYISALMAAYETLFTRLQFFVPDKAVLRYAKFTTMLSIGFNLPKLIKWSDYINKKWRFKNKKEVKEAIASFKQIPSQLNSNDEGES